MLSLLNYDDAGINDDDGDDNNDYRMDLKLKILILIKLYISEFHFWPSVQELFACI